MLASVLAEIVATVLLPESLMTEKLSRRGLRVQTDFEVDVLRSMVVAQVMSTDVETLPVGASVGDARRRLERGEHGAYPLVDPHGVCVGIIARHDLLATTVDDAEPVTTLAAADVVTAAPDDTLLSALRQMLEEDIGHLPVVVSGRLVGMCTRTDIFNARRVRMEHERLQPGWRGLRRRARVEEAR
jgi:CBS domain-containing protein